MIRIGGPRQFAIVRKFLESAYAEDSNILAERVGDFDPAKHQEENVLVRLLFLGRAISAPEWEAAAPEPVRAAFSDLGLIEPASGGRIGSPVLLYRIRSVYVVSDRFTNEEGQVGRPSDDHVYYALTETAQHYLYSLPFQGSYGQALDIGCGSGVGALVLSSVARQVFATDIAARCTHYAEFNRMLNGAGNIAIRQGSLYDPVDGLTFDLIACHPPYDLSLSSKSYVYADGGEDGEFVTRGVISGLPEKLNPGGQFLCAARISDRSGAGVEQRIRQWLGPRHAEFDIAVVVRSVVKIEDHAISASMIARQNLDDYQRYMDFFRSLDIQQLPYVHVLIERKAEGEPHTLRRNAGMRCGLAEMQELLRWARVKNSTDLAGARFVAAPHMELRVRHRFRNGEIVPVEYRFVVEQPFHEEEAVPEWVARLASLCVPDRTAAQVYAAMRKEYPIPAGDFDAAIKRLLSLSVIQFASGNSTISSN